MVDFDWFGAEILSPHTEIEREANENKTQTVP